MWICAICVPYIQNGRQFGRFWVILHSLCLLHFQICRLFIIPLMKLNPSLAFVNATCCALHVFNYNGIVSFDSNADANGSETTSWNSRQASGKQLIQTHDAYRTPQLWQFWCEQKNVSMFTYKCIVHFSSHEIAYFDMDFLMICLRKLVHDASTIKKSD